MGVYHLMGLGRSPGVVTSPLSYLGARYERFDEGDRRFFRRSGERSQREEGHRVGDVEALVLFTTREVLVGEISSRSYVLNDPGTNVGPERPGGPMKDVLRRLLSPAWHAAAGGRTEGRLYWCEVDRRSVEEIYRRVIRVVAALAGVGGSGKEIWTNLTGGSNVQNLALGLAGTLSGQISRTYYVLAGSEDEEKCIRHPRTEGFWVELPTVPLDLGPIARDVMAQLDEGPLPARELWSHISARRWVDLEDTRSEKAFSDRYLRPLWKVGLLAEVPGGYGHGPQWEPIRVYVEEWAKVQSETPPIDDLAEDEEWLEMEIVRIP